ncbi:MAG: winged helix DNA-binding protein [Xanthomonadales bacterium]|nr:winged helix DNA-binding protein [Gammaproteobacteria bacterium]MBT8051716.1 winged helix DNA-binding protein [Gammaproteobacteria bacterium]MBT8057923.1 winged helix DNA-binding protein [Gammaproteobacteria bacterium]NNJ78506.1 winged helix DNA-binding protein [Xanthomonadales bacterium]NNL05734.1 winged helix DNA-binding protein [Xanthomonadales bacterium]
MDERERLVRATDVLTERALTGLFSRAFAQPLKLLGQTEASLSSYAVFWCVAFNEGSTQVEIAGQTGLSAKTVSRVISQLGEAAGGRGWIKQSHDAKDRRVRRLTLSRKGKSVHRQLMRDLQQFDSELSPG